MSKWFRNLLNYLVWLLGPLKVKRFRIDSHIEGLYVQKLYNYSYCFYVIRFIVCLQSLSLRTASLSSLIFGLIAILTELIRTEEGINPVDKKEKILCCRIFSQYEVKSTSLLSVSVVKSPVIQPFVTMYSLRCV